MSCEIASCSRAPFTHSTPLSAALRSQIGLLIEPQFGQSIDYLGHISHNSQKRGPVNNTEVVRGRILLVDDEASVRTAYGRWLTNAGFHVAEASGGYEALGLLENNFFDLVLSDILMPEIYALTLLR